MLEHAMTRRAFHHFLASGLVAAGVGYAPQLKAAVPQSFAVTTPMHIRSVSLRVRDLARMTDFYNRMIGLDILARETGRTSLGKDGTVLLELLAKPADEPDDRVSAGLYHTAFLMPSRRDLGRWLIYAVQSGVAFTGFADHLVSEALYLDDPEGNGIEVYADRSPVGWSWEGNQVVMGTEELDIDNLVAGLPRDLLLSYKAPSGFRIGHVHLRVGDIATAEAYYRGVAGLDVTRLMPERGAAFFANGRYHHHIGSNIWQSQGAGQRSETMAGLDELAFTMAPDLMEGLRGRLSKAGSDVADKGDRIEARDPWGTRLAFISG
jgi:catechol 2,3-dioxygenase